MKIVVDCSSLNANNAGIGRYIENLVSCLNASCKEPEALHDPTFTLQKPNLVLRKPALVLHKIVVQPSKFRILHKFKKAFLFFVLTPLRTRIYAADIYWGPNNRLPFFLPKHTAKVLTVHDLCWRKFPNTMRKLGLIAERILMPYSLRTADIIITISHSTAADIKLFYPQYADKIRVIHLAGVKPSATKSTLNNTAITNNISTITKPYILFVGTIEPRKNLTRLLEAFALLPVALRQNFQLVIAGGAGWGNIDLATRVKDLELESSVACTGYLSYAMLTALYQNAYCLAMPSLYEGFGLPILEAHSYGIPVITSNTASMPEVAGAAAVYVDPDSVTSIAEGLQQLLENKALRDELSHRALENAAKFSWEQTTQGTINVFNEALTRITRL